MCIDQILQELNTEYLILLLPIPKIYSEVLHCIKGKYAGLFYFLSNLNLSIARFHFLDYNLIIVRSKTGICHSGNLLAGI